MLVLKQNVSPSFVWVTATDKVLCGPACPLLFVWATSTDKDICVISISVTEVMKSNVQYIVTVLLKSNPLYVWDITHTYTHIHTRTHTDTHTRTYTYTHTVHTYTHIHIHIQYTHSTHTHTHTHANTYTTSSFIKNDHDSHFNLFVIIFRFSISVFCKYHLLTIIVFRSASTTIIIIISIITM